MEISVAYQSLTEAKPQGDLREVRATSFDKKDFNIIARTGLKLTEPCGFKFKVLPIPQNYLHGCTVLEMPYIDPATGEFCVVMGSCTGQAPFMPEGGTKKVKCGNAEFKAGDVVAILDIVGDFTPVWEE